MFLVLYFWGPPTLGSVPWLTITLPKEIYAPQYLFYFSPFYLSKDLTKVSVLKKKMKPMSRILNMNEPVDLRNK